MSSPSSIPEKGNIENTYRVLEKALRKIGVFLRSSSSSGKLLGSENIKDPLYHGTGWGIRSGEPAECMMLLRTLLFAVSSEVARQMLTQRGCTSHSTDRKLLQGTF
jgi:hypothetical protein